MKITKEKIINYIIIPLLFLIMSIFRDGNLQLLYFLSIVLFVYILLKKKYNFKEFLINLIPFIFIIIFTSNLSSFFISKEKTLVYLMKIILCINLFLCVKNYDYNININKIINSLSIMILILTVIAYFYKSDFLWYLDDKYNGYYTERMRLFFLEPSELSQVCGLIILFKVFFYMRNHMKTNLLLGGLMLIPMILSAGLSGMVYTLIAFVVLLASYELKNVIKGRFSFISLILIISIFLVLMLFMLDSNIYFISRIKTIISGEDLSFDYRFSSAIEAFSALMVETKYVGVGLGNMNTGITLRFLERFYMKKFSNSLMYFFSEGGIIAILYILVLFGYMFYRIYKTSNDYLVKCFRFSLLIFIIVSQIAGGYFTNPFIWLIYGVICSNTMLQRNEFELKNAYESNMLYY